MKTFDKTFDRSFILVAWLAVLATLIASVAATTTTTTINPLSVKDIGGVLPYTFDIPYAWLGILLLAFGISYVVSGGNFAWAGMAMAFVSWVLAFFDTYGVHVIDFNIVAFVTFLGGVMFVYQIFVRQR